MNQEIKYFNIEKYLKELKIEQYVLEHLAELQIEFDNFLKKILSFGKEEAMTYFTLELFNELLYSHQIEDSKILSPSDFLSYDLINQGKYLTNKKICNIQKILLKNTTMPYPIGEYRQVPIFIKRNGENIYQGPCATDVPLFMSDFIKFYNKNSDNLINIDPFIKSSLIQLLFIKIHPFVDGNGRVSRVLHNMKFTDLLNKTYTDKNNKELKLKIAPLNISYSIYRNKQSYYDKLNAIDFEEGVDINSAVNKWLDFLIYMYEEQLYYNEHSNKMHDFSNTMKRMRIL